MRPTKLTPRLINAFKTVLDNEMYLKVCTDLELCHLINKELPEDEQISYRTFQRYKCVVKEHAYLHTHRQKMDEEYELYHKLYTLWMDARIAMKVKMMEFIEKKVTGWQRYRWLLEKRFKEFATDPSIFPTRRSSDFAPSMADDRLYMRYRERQQYLAKLATQPNNNDGN